MNVVAVTKPGKIGEFEVFVDGQSVAKRGGNFLTRSFGAGYPDPDEVVARLAEKTAKSSGAQSIS